MNVIIDTCVILDVLQNRVPFVTEGITLFDLASEKVYLGYIATSSLTDIYYLMHKRLHNDLLTRQTLKNLLTFFELVETAAADCKRALNSEIKDYEDAIVVQTALRCGFDGIVTRNQKDFKNSRIKIYTPKEFIEKL